MRFLKQKNIVLNWQVVLLCWLSSLSSIGCQHEQQGLPNAPVTQVSVAKPLVTEIVEWDNYTGRLEAIDSVEIRSRVSGYLSSIHFTEGTLVNEGDLLMIIDQKPFQAALLNAVALQKQAEARLQEVKAALKKTEAEHVNFITQLKLKKSQFERVQKLFEKNAVTKEEVEIRESEVGEADANLQASLAQIESAKAAIMSAEATIETAKANVVTAELDLSYTLIRAPISGLISGRYVTEGNLISGGNTNSTLLTTIVSTDPIHCYFDADEQAFLKYSRLNQEGKRPSSRDSRNPVYMRLIDEQGYPHHGHMDFVDNQLDPNTATIRGRAIFRNPQNLLSPGLFAYVRLPGSGKYSAILVPDTAVGSDQAENFVYVVTADKTVERVSVKLGSIRNGLRIVKSGLKGDELIITRGIQKVFPKIKVETVEDEPVKFLSDDGLPNDYKPTPKEEWINRPTNPVPQDLPQQKTSAHQHVPHAAGGSL